MSNVSFLTKMPASLPPPLHFVSPPSCPKKGRTTATSLTFFRLCWKIRRALIAARNKAVLKLRHFSFKALGYQPAAKFSTICKLEPLPQKMTTFLGSIGQKPALARVLDRPHKPELQDRGKVQNSAEKDHRLAPKAIELIESVYAQDFDVFEYQRLSSG